MTWGNDVRQAGLGLALALLAATAGMAQQAQFPFGGLKSDPKQPVEIAADNLSVNQADNTATFQGNVVIGQGQMRLAAPQVRVEYAGGTKDTPRRISRLLASGGVTLSSGTEAAEGKDAVYTVDTGNVVMTGNVVLTQGDNVITGDKLVVDLTNGTGTMTGRVRTILNQAPAAAAGNN